MIIRVYDGDLDASKISLVTPVIPVSMDENGKPIKEYFVVQITCDGTRSALRYETEKEAIRERNFIVANWMDSIKQEAIIVMPELKGEDSDKKTDKKGSSKQPAKA